MDQDAHIDRAAATSPLVLAIDVGTSSARALVYDARGRLVDGLEAHQRFRVTASSQGAAEIDAENLTDLVCGCVDQVLDAAGTSSAQIRAVACDTFWHSVMGVSEGGSAMTPVYTWEDTRSAGAARELRNRLDEHEVLARTGAGLHASYPPAKLLWLFETQTRLAESVDFWMSFGEYLYFRLFGVRSVSISMASATGMFDQRRCAWDGPVLRVLPVREAQLSPIAEFDQTHDGLRSEYARRWPQLSGVPWYLPLGDGACNNIGSGGTRADRWVVMIGTSGAMRVVRETEDLRFPRGLWTYRVDRGRVVQGGALSDGGNVYSWLRQTLLLPPPGEMEDAIAKMEPDSHHLTVLPFLAGERSPGWNLNARAAFVGMGLDTQAVDMVRAALEAVALRFGLLYRSMQEVLPEPESIIGSGVGLVHSPAWSQIVTDVLGRAVVTSAVPEATSRGAALLVLESMGALPSVQSAPVPLGRTHDPVKRHYQAYRRAEARQRKLYDLLVRPSDGLDTVKSQAEDGE